MNTLSQLQVNFKETLLNENNAITPFLTHSSSTKSYAAINIYKNAYQLRLIQTLQSDYPTLEKLLGHQAFKKLAIEYIAKHPSKSYTLRGFGQHLSNFLTQETVYKKQPYLAEMAEFEWQLANVFDLANTQLATVNQMRLIKADDWPFLTIKFQPSLRWLNLHWNIVDVYQAVLSKSVIPDLVYSSNTKYCLIWRKQLACYFRTVEAREWFAMQVLNNSNFTELCETLMALDGEKEDSALNAAIFLKTWLSADLIESIEILEQEP